MSDEQKIPESHENDVAIVGMSVHVPGAKTLAQYWDNLRNGVESIQRLSDEDLRQADEDPALLHHKNYVPAAAILDDFKLFDADFFGFSPKEAAILDPQHRRFLEVSWQAFENAGHVPENFDGKIGVYAGCGMGSYFYFNLCSNKDLVDDTGMFLLRHTGNDKDFLSTRLSHILDLKGPSISVQTACSTSLVALHMAAQSLMTGECDMAVAGGVTIEMPHGRGYVFKDGEILSPDGHCHAFDHRAQGTVFGSGAGAVILRRMEDALADGDHIWGVIKGSAINNDGAAKAGYLAPSVDGQAEAIADAHMMSGVSADTIDYVECHGTGTYLGDPIEVAALTEAFAQSGSKMRHCGIGSVKTNIGHLDTAAGVASIVKTTLALKYQQLPPTIGYASPNPSIDFENSPFYVNDTLKDWPQPRDHKRRAGVNSLGVGGTNAHVVIEEAPLVPAADDSDWPFQILPISGKSKAALAGNITALADHLDTDTTQSFADVAYTLKQGRRAFELRAVVVANDHQDAAELLRDNDPRRVFNHKYLGADTDAVFMFPGGGAQYVDMAKDLYETEPVFQEWMDTGLEILAPKLDYDIRALWQPALADANAAQERLKKPSVQLPLILIVEYALAQLWMSWGVQPAALVGHSMGENTAACVAGVMSFEDCIGLVHLRGTLFDTVPAGGMLSIPLPRVQVEKLLSDQIDLASVNAPELCVVSGPDSALDALAKKLDAKDITTQRIAIDIAAHSKMLDPILGAFREYLQSITLNAPNLPIISNRSGTYLTDTEATDPEYWVAHLRGTVFFAQCIETLASKPNRAFIEVGPGKTLCTLTSMSDFVEANQVINTLRHPDDIIADDKYFLTALARTWAVGVDFDWSQIWGDAKRRKVPLPTYAFQHKSYFIEPAKNTAPSVSNYLSRTDDVQNWGYKPVWRPKYADCILDVKTELDQAEIQTWLIFNDTIGVGQNIADRLRTAGHPVVLVDAGDAFAKLGDHHYIIPPERGRDGFDNLFKDLSADGITPNRIVNLWLLTLDETHRAGSSFFHKTQEQGFYAMLFLAQSIIDENIATPLHITCVTTGAVQVKNEPLVYPEKATLAGPLRVIPKELSGVTCASLDVDLQGQSAKRKPTAKALDNCAAQILTDLISPAQNYSAAIRTNNRFELDYSASELIHDETKTPVFKPDGTYLITGGFGGIGKTLALHIAKTTQANIVLMSRSAMPERTQWDSYLSAHSPIDSGVKQIKLILELEAFGSQVLAVQGDVCNTQDVQDIRAQASKQLGAITGVIHAAGTVNDGPLLSKHSAEIEDVFAPKIHGTQVLDTVFMDGELDWLVLFSSTSTVIAPIGQIDYVAANEYLNAFAKSKRGGRTKVVAINWGIWNDVGMAADAVASRLNQPHDMPVTKLDNPLLDQMSFDPDGHRIFETTLNVADRWVLDQHRTKDGAAILPGTAYIELMSQALHANGERGDFEVQDLFFLRAFEVDDATPLTLHIKLERTPKGYQFGLYSKRTIQGRAALLRHAQAKLVLLNDTDVAPQDADAIFARSGTATLAKTGQKLHSPQEKHLDFGPRWQVVDKQAYGDNEAIAALSLNDAFVADLEAGYQTHPALLDLATGWAMHLISGYQADHLWVPVSYSSIKIYGALPAKIYSWVRNAADNLTNTSIASFDVTLFDETGRVLIDIVGFSIKQIDENSAFQTGDNFSPAEVLFVDTKDAANLQLSPVEERLHHNLSMGILPAEGVAAFEAALGTDLPQIIISSLPLDGLISQADQDGLAADTTKHVFERPDLDNDYTAPSNDIERNLASFWQDLLGVSQVGIKDNFFDLGGHSLIAVRLFSMIKKTYQTDFPISILFEAPTVEKCAALIAERVGVTDNADSIDAPSQSPKHETRFSHLVPMHTGEGGDKQPFFLVAGMFGNVLNLRHLAHLLGADRPFYGLQARGLLGEAEPHRTIEQAATDYIAEMRQVQPKGPYMLGGFSGGGITAFEIAQQLETMGETVSLLVLLDTPLPQRRALSRKDRLVIQWQELKKSGPAYVLRWAKNRIRWEFAKRRMQNTTTPTATHEFNNAAIEAAFLQAVGSYEMQSWSGNIKLIRPPLVGKWHVGDGRWIDDERAYVLHDNDWGQFTPQIDVIEVPGDHDSMVLEPNVRVMAAKIKPIIEAAQ